MGNIMDGELGIMSYCDRCGKELFRRAERGKFIVDKGTIFQHINKYEDLPKGLVVIGTDLNNDIMNAKNDHDTAFKAFKAALDAGSFNIDGDCYIPDEYGEEIAEFNI